MAPTFVSSAKRWKIPHEKPDRASPQRAAEERGQRDNAWAGSAQTLPTDIRPLFRDSPDVDTMRGYGLNLSSYEDVRARVVSFMTLSKAAAATLKV